MCSSASVSPKRSGGMLRGEVRICRCETPRCRVERVYRRGCARRRASRRSAPAAPRPCRAAAGPASAGSTPGTSARAPSACRRTRTPGPSAPPTCTRVLDPTHVPEAAQPLWQPMPTNLHGPMLAGLTGPWPVSWHHQLAAFTGLVQAPSSTLCGGAVGERQGQSALVGVQVVELLLRVLQALGRDAVLLLQQRHDAGHVLQVPARRGAQTSGPSDPARCGTPSPAAAQCTLMHWARSPGTCAQGCNTRRLTPCMTTP